MTRRQHLRCSCAFSYGPACIEDRLGHRNSLHIQKITSAGDHVCLRVPNPQLTTSC